MLFWAILLTFLAIVLWVLFPTVMNATMLLVDIGIIFFLIFELVKLFKKYGVRKGLKIIFWIIMMIAAFVFGASLPMLITKMIFKI